MRPEDWNQAWALLNEAQQLPPGRAQREFVERSGAPPDVVGQVLSILEGEQTEPPPPAPGVQYGKYTLLSPLGSGGMGEVFLARDTELGRLVAIKFVGGRARAMRSAMDRLEQEAQAASALNHPHLVTVHEVLRFDSGLALVTEYVQGQSLRTFCGIARPFRQVAEWGSQIARALAAAHAQGIVHGDIKPENIMLRGDGYIKILDFGLASRLSGGASIEDIPLGTVGYMSPEQTRGNALSGGSDVFSLGVVLLELVTGKHPFLESTASSTTAAINEREAVPEIPARGTLGQMRRLLQRMLSKNPAARPSAAEAANELSRIAAAREGVPARVLVAGAAAALVAAVLWWSFGGGPDVPQLKPAVQLTDYSGIESQPAWSPDGTMLAFVWSGPDNDNDDVYVKVSGSGELRRVTRDPRVEFFPQFSPDGKWLAYQRRAPDGHDAEVLVTPAAGGPERLVARVADPEGFIGLAWWPDSGSLIVRDAAPGDKGLFRISLADGSKTPLMRSSEGDDSRQTVSPDRHWLAFVRKAWSDNSICRLDLTSLRADRCIPVEGNVFALAWQGDSRGVFYSTENALSVLDLASAAPAASPVLQGVFRNVTVDRAGTRLTFNRSLSDSNIWRLDVATQKVTRFVATSDEDSEPQYSPDGKQVVFRSKKKGSFNLFVADASGGNIRQLTSLNGHLGSGRWSPDGRWIVFDYFAYAGPGRRTRRNNVWVVSSGGGDARLVTDDRLEAAVPGWSADGRWLWFSEDQGNPRRTWRVPFSGGPAELLDASEMWDLAVSGDGRWVCFERTTGVTGVWRRPASGGTAELLQETSGLVYRSWDLRGDMLWYLSRTPVPGFRRLDIRHPERSTYVGPAPRRIFHGPRVMTAAPDGSAILYTSEDLTVGDLFAMQIVRP